MVRLDCFGPKPTCHFVLVDHTDLPFASMSPQDLLESRQTNAPSAISLEDEELGNKKAVRSVSYWAAFYDKSKAGKLITSENKVGILPEAIKKLVLKPSVSSHRKRQVASHVIEVKLDQVANSSLVVGFRLDN